MYTTLITPAQLQALALQTQPQASAALCIWDCSFDLMQPSAGEAAFIQTHIAGARYVNLDTDLSDKSGAPDAASGGRHPLPSREKFVAWLGAQGVGPATQVVVYDRNGCNYCGRAWWMLQWCGHAAVAVLDGGLQGWIAAGGTLESGEAAAAATVNAAAPALPAASKTVNSTPKYLLAGGLVEKFAIEDVANGLKTGQQTIIDARAAPRFRGDVEPLDPVAGHIPGALNRPFAENFQADGRFKPAAQLRAEFDTLLAGRDPASVVHHCGSGVSAVPNLLAMAIAGYPAGALFAGSWSEWSRRADLPVARG